MKEDFTPNCFHMLFPKKSWWVLFKWNVFNLKYGSKKQGCNFCFLLKYCFWNPTTQPNTIASINFLYLKALIKWLNLHANKTIYSKFWQILFENNLYCKFCKLIQHQVFYTWVQFCYYYYAVFGITVIISTVRSRRCQEKKKILAFQQ